MARVLADVRYVEGWGMTETASITLMNPPLRLLGRQRTLMLLLTGEPMTAAQAQALGALNSLTDAYFKPARALWPQPRPASTAAAHTPLARRRAARIGP